MHAEVDPQAPLLQVLTWPILLELLVQDWVVFLQAPQSVNELLHDTVLQEVDEPQAPLLQTCVEPILVDVLFVHFLLLFIHAPQAVPALLHETLPEHVDCSCQVFDIHFCILPVVPEFTQRVAPSEQTVASHLPPTNEYPLLHPVATHTPDEQFTVVEFDTVEVLQTLPQEPQLFISVCILTQLDPLGQ